MPVNNMPGCCCGGDCSCVVVRFSGISNSGCVRCDELNDTWNAPAITHGLTPEIVKAWQTRLCSESHVHKYCRTLDTIKVTVTSLEDGAYRVDVEIFYGPSPAVATIRYSRTYDAYPNCQNWNDEEIEFDSEEYSVGSCSCSAAASSVFLTFDAEATCDNGLACGEPCFGCCDEWPTAWEVNIDGLLNGRCDGCEDANGTYVISEFVDEGGSPCQWRYIETGIGQCDLSPLGGMYPGGLFIQMRLVGFGDTFCEAVLEVQFGGGPGVGIGATVVGATYSGQLVGAGCPKDCNAAITFTKSPQPPFPPGSACEGTLPDTIIATAA